MSDFDKRFPPVPPVPPVPPPSPVPPHRHYPHPTPFPHRHRKPLNHEADFAPMIMHPHIPHHFNFWCNKVIPLVYDDRLSYYEVLAKTVDYLNHVINDVKMGAINIEELAQAFCELQRFVNDYFAWYQSKGLINYEIAITNDNYEKYLPDLDVAQMNTVYRFKFVEGSEQTLPDNLPDAAKPFSGAECVLFNLSNFQLKRVGNQWCEITNDDKDYSTANNYQLFITDKDIYFRENNGDSWGEWSSIFANWWSSEFENVKAWVREYVTPLVNDLSARIAAEVARATAAEQALDDKIEAETDRATAAEQAETNRATAAENALSQRLVAEYERAAAKEAELEQAIEDETDRAEQVEGNLQTAIQTETTRATNAEAAIRTDLNAEVTRATARENQISGAIADVARELAEEIVDRQQADENLQDNIDDVAADLAAEVTRAQGAESGLAGDIADVAGDLADEVTRAQGAEQDIRDSYIPNAGNTKTTGFSLIRDSFYFGGNSPTSGGGFTIGNVPTYTFNLPSSAPLLYVSALSGHAFSEPVINVSNAAVSLNYTSQGSKTGIMVTNGKAYYLNPDNPSASDNREIAVMSVVGSMIGSAQSSIMQTISGQYIPNGGNTVSDTFTLNRTAMRLISGETRLELTNGGGLFLLTNQIELGRPTVGAISLRGNNAYLYRTDSEIQALSSSSDYEIVRRSDLAGYIPNEGNTTTDELIIRRDEITLSANTNTNRPVLFINSDGVVIEAFNQNAYIDIGQNSVDDVVIHAEDGTVHVTATNTKIEVWEGITYTDSSTSSNLIGFKIRYNNNDDEILYKMFAHTANGDLISNLTSPTTIELVQTELERLAEMGYTGKVVYNDLRINIDVSATAIDINNSDYMVAEFNNCTFNWTVSQEFKPQYNKWVFNHCVFAGDNPVSAYNLEISSLASYEFNSCVFSGCGLLIDTGDIINGVFNNCTFSIGTGKLEIATYVGSTSQYSDSRSTVITFTNCINLKPIIDTTAVTESYVDEVVIIGCYMNNGYVAPSKPICANKYYNNVVQPT